MGLSTRAVALASAALAFLTISSCAAGTTSIGPLTMDVPKGWLVTDREETNLKLTDGTIADENSTRPGTAKAVFDIYVESTQTPKSFEKYLREQHIAAMRERTRIDGYDTEIFRYAGAAVGGRQEAVFVPRWRVFILYRAAFPGDDPAFFRGRAAFRLAVDSITFSGKPSSASGAFRHGPTFGKSAMTASTDPIAIITKPS